MMKQDKSLKDTTMACSCNSGSVYCVYVTENTYIKKEVGLQAMQSIIRVKELHVSTLHMCLKSRRTTKNFRQDSESRNTG
jgi:hypothetical protein